jgi:hypothetical protein
MLIVHFLLTQIWFDPSILPVCSKQNCYSTKYIIFRSRAQTEHNVQIHKANDIEASLELNW